MGVPPVGVPPVGVPPPVPPVTEVSTTFVVMVAVHLTRPPPPSAESSLH
jgi:hypothetical protein